jgi:hypothetical protein
MLILFYSVATHEHFSYHLLRADLGDRVCMFIGRRSASARHQHWFSGPVEELGGALGRDHARAPDGVNLGGATTRAA